jgi:hypothetical protein
MNHLRLCIGYFIKKPGSFSTEKRRPGGTPENKRGGLIEPAAFRKITRFAN